MAILYGIFSGVFSLFWVFYLLRSYKDFFPLCRLDYLRVLWCLPTTRCPPSCGNFIYFFLTHFQFAIVGIILGIIQAIFVIVYFTYIGALFACIATEFCTVYGNATLAVVFLFLDVALSIAIVVVEVTFVFNI